MSLFPETIAAAMRGARPRCANLVLLDFVGEPMRLWTGNGLLTAGGFEWAGIGSLGSMSGLEQAVNGEAPEATFTLTGIDGTIMRLARDEFDAKARNRRAVAYIQFFNEDDDRTLDQPFPVWGGRMHAPQFTIQGSTREVSVTCESLFTLRSRPNFAMYTDRDQQKRFDGDRGFEFVATLVNKVVTWPDY